MSQMTVESCVQMIRSGRASIDQLRSLAAAGRVAADFLQRVESALSQPAPVAAAAGLTAADLLAAAGPRIVPHYVKGSDGVTAGRNGRVKPAKAGYFLAEIVGVPGVAGFTSRITPAVLSCLLPASPAHDSPLHASGREFLARLERQTAQGINPFDPLAGWNDPLAAPAAPAPQPAPVPAPQPAAPARSHGVPAHGKAR